MMSEGVEMADSSPALLGAICINVMRRVLA